VRSRRGYHTVHGAGPGQRRGGAQDGGAVQKAGFAGDVGPPAPGAAHQKKKSKGAGGGENKKTQGGSEQRFAAVPAKKRGKKLWARCRLQTGAGPRTRPGSGGNSGHALATGKKNWVFMRGQLIAGDGKRGKKRLSRDVIVRPSFQAQNRVGLKGGNLAGSGWNEGEGETLASPKWKFWPRPFAGGGGGHNRPSGKKSGPHKYPGIT